MAQVGAFLPTSLVSLGFGRHEKQGDPLLFRRITDAASEHTVSHPLPQRNSANYQPSLWSYDFVQSLNSVFTDGKYKDRARKLLEEVRRMMKDQTADIWAKLELIDHVQRLGLGYHLDNDIVEVLDSFVSLKTRFDTTQTKSLYEVALSFRLLRDHGYNVSPDIFQRFKNDKGKFKASLCSDVKGMLSLYEATYLGYEGEDLLDEARAFSITNLKHIKEGVSNDLLAQVAHALELPMHRNTRKLEARWYIEAYSKRKDANKVLLEAAKLDFNIVQSTLQKDLQEMLRWWKGIGLAAKLNFSRDRLVECFFWTVGMVSEPQFSDLRKALTKVGCFITTIDDVYDVYGTLDELELFTAIVERWDINAVHVLPEYMKICFIALYNTVNEMAYHALKEHGHNILPCLTKAWTDMLKTFLQEAKWSHDKYLPPFKDYLRNGWVSVSGVLILVHAYCFSNQNISKEALESLENHHDVLRWPSIIFRLCNDIGTSKAELERGETASSIVCYMHETGVYEERAYDHMESLIDETWKKMNKERATDSPIFSKNFKEIAINLARISHCTYQYGDGHGAPDAISKNRIQSLIIEPIELHLRKVINPPKYTYNHLKSLGGGLATRSVNSLANCYRVRSLFHVKPRKRTHMKQVARVNDLQ